VYLLTSISFISIFSPFSSPSHSNQTTKKKKKNNLLALPVLSQIYFAAAFGIPAALKAAESPYLLSLNLHVTDSPERTLDGKKSNNITCFVTSFITTIVTCFITSFITTIVTCFVTSFVGDLGKLLTRLVTCVECSNQLLLLCFITTFITTIITCFVTSFVSDCNLY